MKKIVTLYGKTLSVLLSISLVSTTLLLTLYAFRIIRSTKHVCGKIEPTSNSSPFGPFINQFINVVIVVSVVYIIIAVWAYFTRIEKSQKIEQKKFASEMFWKGVLGLLIAVLILIVFNIALQEFRFDYIDYSIPCLL